MGRGGARHPPGLGRPAPAGVGATHQVTAFSPQTFASIREALGVSEAEFVGSLGVRPLLGEMMSLVSPLCVTVASLRSISPAGRALLRLSSASFFLLSSSSSFFFLSNYSRNVFLLFRLFFSHFIFATASI